MASNTNHCKDCDLFFDSPQSLDVHLQYHKENLLSMWMRTEENKRDNDELENRSSFVQINHGATLSDASCGNIFTKQNENEMVHQPPSYGRPPPASPMEYDFKAEPGITSPQECYVSQGPSSRSGVNNYSQPSPNGYYQDYHQHHSLHGSYNSISPTFIDESFEEQYYSRPITSARYHPYVGSPLPTPSPGISVEMKEERLSPNAPEILDLDSQKLLSSNVSQNHLEALPSMWRPNDHYQLPNHLSGSVNDSLSLNPTSNIGPSTVLNSSPTEPRSSNDLRLSLTELGPTSAERELTPTELQHSIAELEHSTTGLRPSSTVLDPSSILGLGQPETRVKQSSTSLGIHSPSSKPLHTGYDQSSSLISPSSALGSKFRPVSGLGFSSGFNINSLEPGAPQHMPPPLQQPVYENQLSVHSNNQISVPNNPCYSNSPFSSYYSQGLPVNSGMSSNPSIQFVSPPIQSPSSRERPQSEYPSNVKRAKSFHCEACNKWFTSHGHLKRHYNTTLHKNMTKLNESSANSGTQSVVTDTIQPPILSPSSKSSGETSTTSSHGDESNLSTNDSTEQSASTFQPFGSAFQPLPVNNTNFSTQSSYLSPSFNNATNFTPVRPNFNQVHSFSQEPPLTAPSLYHGHFSNNPTYMPQNPVIGSGSAFFLGNNYMYQSQQGGLHGPGVHLANEYPGPSSVENLNSFQLENDRGQHQYTNENEKTPVRITPDLSCDTGSEASLDSSESSRASPADSYKCNDCNKTFNRMCYLTQHRSTYHEGEKPFKCSICGKRFTDEVIFTDHQGKHAGEKPYKCEICPKQFNHKTDLRRHMCLHTGEKPFTCEQCGKGFIRKDHMIKHSQTHRKKALAAAANAAQSHPSMPPNPQGFISHNGIHPHGSLPHPSPGPLGHPHVVY